MLRSRRPIQLLAHAVLVATTVFVLFPYAWMLMTSIKPIADVVAWPVRWLPRVVTLENYAAILGDARFLRSLVNSAAVSIAVTAISLVLSVPAAYGLTRLVRGGGRPMLIGILASQFFPPMVFFVPFYIMLQSVGLLNTLTGLTFAYLSVTLPICTWMVATSLRDIPVEIEEAARIDGCGDLRIIRSIILPIAAPGIVTAGIFAFVLSWQEYIFALLYTTSERAQTAPVLMYYLLGQHQIDYARLMAAAVLLSIPIAVPFAFIQRTYRSGMTEGGIKG
ncbi:MAG TPA: carbohydrate ABC transporter permease [Caldimonas sp.]|jgi:ABC-type glycerol-3-phosphate transport system permease component|nr:carbohydrate ABC transporter permease [Caldimonas sp.]HEX2541359.1 carbohydrate ABC transporter permease [Caldimonas sp.]